MNSGLVKIRLKAGSREFEAEGPTKDIVELLGKFWRPAEDDAEPDDGEETENSQRKEKKAKAPRARATRSSNSTKKSEDNFDAVKIANAIKSLPALPQITQKIIHASGVVFQKAALVLRYSTDPLTSGQIRRVLEVLGVKVSLPSLSKTLADNISSLMTDGVRSRSKPAKYSLTSRAASEFDAWLKKKDE